MYLCSYASISKQAQLIALLQCVRQERICTCRYIQAGRTDCTVAASAWGVATFNKRCRNETLVHITYIIYINVYIYICTKCIYIYMYVHI